ncbi:hypothetical protein [Micromonospora sp. SH-82]|uniref:hypothetical protein n=1 Tax=Micromonospora sp. SH-82 TaxID=3132938 RepID=UPI003EBFBC96
MRDDAAFVKELRDELSQVCWLAPEEIRARGEWRSRRVLLLTFAVVLVMVSGAGVVVVARHLLPSAPTTVTGPTLLAEPQSRLDDGPLAGDLTWPLAEPDSGEIPAQALLQPADLPTGVGEHLTELGLGETVEVNPMLEACRQERGLPSQAVSSQLSRSQTLLGTGPAPDLLLMQDVYRVAPQTATRFFTDLDVRMAPCASWRSVGDVEIDGRPYQAAATHRFTVSARDFAGDGSVLLRHTMTAPIDQSDGRQLGPSDRTDSVVVRVGDLVTVLRLGPESTEKELRRLAGVAAQRMCVASRPTC